MASSSVTYRIALSVLDDLIAKWRGDDTDPGLAEYLTKAAYNREFKPRTQGGEVIVLTFQLDPNGAEQPEDG